MENPTFEFIQEKAKKYDVAYFDNRSVDSELF